MAVEVTPIRSQTDYADALKEIERLWGAKSGTLDGDRLDVLATLVDAYENEHYPMDPPDPVETIEFRMEQQGLNPARPPAADRVAHPGRRNSDPKTRSFRRHDPPAA